jgi:hypothetical protein
VLSDGNCTAGIHIAATQRAIPEQLKMVDIRMGRDYTGRLTEIGWNALPVRTRTV